MRSVPYGIDRVYKIEILCRFLAECASDALSVSYDKHIKDITITAIEPYVKVTSKIICIYIPHFLFLRLNGTMWIRTTTMMQLQSQPISGSACGNYMVKSLNSDFTFAA